MKVIGCENRDSSNSRFCDKCPYNDLLGDCIEHRRNTFSMFITED